MLNVVIIDDKETAIYFLASLINSKIEILGTTSNLNDGIEIIDKTQPDFVFLDVNPAKGKRLDIYNEFEPLQFKIIICNAYQKCVSDILRIFPKIYLLKSAYFMELTKILRKVLEEHLLDQKQLQIENKMNILNTLEEFWGNIILNVANGFIIGNTRNIEYCYTKNAFSVIVTTSQIEFFVTKSLNELQDILPKNQFYRIHKSYLVNINYIQKFVCANEKYVIMERGIKIPVSTSAI